MMRSDQARFLDPPERIAHHAAQCGVGQSLTATKSFAMDEQKTMRRFEGVVIEVTLETLIFAAMPQNAGTRGRVSLFRVHEIQQSRHVKIAQIAPLVESVPPRLYGGTERVVSWLTEELVAQGHEVTLFASGDSRTRAKLHAIVPQALRLEGVNNSLPYNIIMLDQVARRMDEFDVMHFHIDFFHYPIFRNMAHRTLTTLHGRQDLPELPDIYRAFSHMPLVSISNHQRLPVPPVNWMGTVYHGLPDRQFMKARPGRRIWRSWAASSQVRRRHRDRAARRRAPQDRRQGGSGGSGLLRRRDQAAAGQKLRMSNSSAKSMIGCVKAEFPWAMPGRCCSRSIGRSPSAW